jgi:hypothetical protein
MNHPANYTQEEWASWYERAQTHARVTPRLARDLRASRGLISGTLLATAAASLAELDHDIVAGEFLARMTRSSSSSDAVTAIVDEMSRVAQDLLQAIVDARGVVIPPAVND